MIEFSDATCGSLISEELSVINIIAKECFTVCTLVTCSKYFWMSLTGNDFHHQHGKHGSTSSDRTSQSINILDLNVGDISWSQCAQ